MRSILDAAAAHERALTGHGPRPPWSPRRARGERSGEVPYGFASLRRVMGRTSYRKQRQLPESVANGCSGQLTCHVPPEEQVNVAGHEKLPYP